MTAGPDVARDAVARALVEDLGDRGDLTSQALIDEDTVGRAVVVARAPGTLAGTGVAAEAFRQVDGGLKVTVVRDDGEAAGAGDAILEVEGALRSILTAERTALNFLGHLSGIATLTRQYVDAVDAVGPGVTILDTRKTVPGLRDLEKAAVAAGGGSNHRMGLFDAVLVKDNHLAQVGITEAVKRAREHAPGMLVEVECDTLDQVDAAVEAGADRVLLDNMTPAQVAQAVARVGGRAGMEVSGGVSLDNVAAYAEAGPDFISVGALTHSAPALDVSLEVRA